MKDLKLYLLLLACSFTLNVFAVSQPIAQISLNKTKCSVGELITATIQVTDNHLDSVSWLQADAVFGKYELFERKAFSNTLGKYKNFEYQVIFTTAKAGRILFDPVAIETFRDKGTIKIFTDSISVQVEPTKLIAALHDIRPIKQNSFYFIASKGSSMILCAILTFIVCLSIYISYRKKLHANTNSDKEKAIRKLVLLDQQLKGDDALTITIPDEVSKILKEYFKGLYLFTPLGEPIEGYKKKLVNLGLGEHHVTQIIDFLAFVDKLRFSGISFEKDSYASLLKEAKNCIYHTPSLAEHHVSA